MNAKSVTTFVLGALVGGLCMFLLSRGSEPAPGPAPEARVALPRITSGSDATKIARLEKKIAELEAASSTEGVGEKGSSNVVKVFGGDGASQIDFEELREQMEKGEKQRSEKLVSSRLVTLTSKLNLSEEQAEKVRELLERDVASQSGSVAVILESALAGGLQREVEASDEFDFDAELDALLDDDQKSAYVEHIDAQNENYIEASANRQLAQLQTSVPDLTKDQKDRAFEQFARLAREEVEISGSPAVGGSNLDVAQILKQREVRQEALGEILTPEQAQVYRAEDRSVLTFQGNTGVAMTSSLVIGTPEITIPAEAPPGDGGE